MNGIITAGRHSYICNPKIKGNISNVYIGDFVSIGENCTFDCGFQHKRAITRFPLHKIWDDLPSNVESGGDIVIGSDVWIGQDCTIMSGVTIGNGAIIGAGTVVRGDIPEYCTYTGISVMGKQFFERYTKDQIKRLLDVAWWRWDDQKIKVFAPYLHSEDIDKFIELAEDKTAW